MPIGSLIVGSRSWVDATVLTVSARGRIEPRLVLVIELRTPTERIETELHDVRVQLLCEDEPLGEGRFVGERALWHAPSHELEIPVSRRALDWITDRLGPHAGVDLMLRWQGLLRVRWDSNEADNRFAGDPVPGEWTFLHMPYRQNEHRFAVPRSDWFSKVLQPLGTHEFIYVEVALPHGPDEAQWTKALDRVAEAEKCYALGDDSGVFAKLKGAFEAIPGAPKGIFDALPEPKRTALDTLVRSFVTVYINHGRHVAAGGALAGDFPVDRTDARFALDAARVILGYISRTVTATGSADESA